MMFFVFESLKAHHAIKRPTSYGWSLLGDDSANVNGKPLTCRAVLQLSRATTSKMIKFYDVDFNCIVLNAIDQIWALSNKLNVEMQHDLDRDDLWVYAETDLLEQAMLNLHF